MALGNKGGFVRPSSILRALRTGQTYVRMVESRRTALVMLLWFFLVSSAWVFNLNSRGVNHPHGDEWHTLILGTQNFGSFEEPVESARVGETNRWFVRLLHPAAIYYMNSHMGGEHYLTGWEYPGGYYLREHFDATDDIRDDPNIQDYVFFLRASFGVLAVLSFCMVMWALSGRFGIAAAATYGSLVVLLHPIVFSQFDIFYSETTLFILFNTAAFLCLRTQPLTTYALSSGREFCLPRHVHQADGNPDHRSVVRSDSRRRSEKSPQSHGEYRGLSAVTPSPPWCY